MALVQKAFSDIITFSRSSNATRVGPTGLVEYAPHNLLTYSQEFDNAAWTSFNSTVTANSTAAPNGTVTAESITVGGAYSTGGVYQVVSVSSGATYTFSAYFKKGVGDGARIGFTESGTDRNVNFNLATGTITSIDSGVTGTITSAGNSWYRVTVTRTVSAASVSCYLFSSNAASTGDLFYLWGAQLAVGPYALDYTPTTSAAVYGPRFDYDPSGVTIVDPVSRNLLTYSEQFDNAAWTKRSIALTGSQSAPNGSSTAFLAVPSTATFADMYIAASGSSAMYTVSFFAKASGKNWIYLLSAQGASANWAWFNLTNGVVGTTNGAGLSATITSAGNGWYRCTVSQESVSNYVQIGISDADGSVSVTGSGSNGVFIWGAQIEVGSQATSYMVSGATNGSRAVPVTSGTATARGLLVEEQRTNTCTYSEQINQWSATSYNVTVTANAVTSPDGQVTAETVASDTTNSYHLIGHADVAFTSGSTYTFSIFVKAGTARYVQILFGSAAFPLTEYANFDLQTGTVVGGDTADATISALANGWYRLAYKGTANASINDRAYLGIITTASAARAEVYTQVLSIYAWGAQIEAGSFATSYIPTLASTVTRSADVASVDTLSPWFNATEGTMYGEGSLIGSPLLFMPHIDDGTNDNRFICGIGQGSSDQYVISSGVTQAQISLSGVSQNQVAKVAMAYKVNDIAASLNGGTVGTDTSATIPAVTTLRIGSNAASVFSNGHIRRIAYYPRRLTNAELQALTA